jgi:hypothetical protein
VCGYTMKNAKKNGEKIHKNRKYQKKIKAFFG